MRRSAHTLSNRTMDENGVTDKYKEFEDSSFGTSFQKLEQPDYEIRASQRKVTINKEDDMKGTRHDASYVGELSSGFDAKTQDDYEAGHGDKGQIGKGHQEEVAPSDNWKGDKRDAIGRAATVKLMRRTAARLTRLADALELTAEVEDETIDDLGADMPEDEFEDLDDDDLDVEAAVESTKRQAAHPINHDPKKDDPAANMDSDTGDEWIDIGPGEFNEKRDEIGRAGVNE